MKKLTPVSISGATVCTASSDIVCFILSDLDLMWVRVSDFPWMKDFDLKPGALFWIYWAVRGIPIGLAPSASGDKIEDMPQMEPIAV